MNSVLNELSQYTYLYISKTLLHTLLLLVFKMVESFRCILKGIFNYLLSTTCTSIFAIWSSWSIQSYTYEKVYYCTNKARFFQKILLWLQLSIYSMLCATRQMWLNLDCTNIVFTNSYVILIVLVPPILR